uniref:Uncharacterized protein n=1 Tax=Arundo donax TaxID=35708 RepID=A0A0A9BRG6_ARUDO
MWFSQSPTFPFRKYIDLPTTTLSLRSNSPV